MLHNFDYQHKYGIRKKLTKPQIAPWIVNAMIIIYFKQRIDHFKLHRAANALDLLNIRSLVLLPERQFQ